MVIRGAIYRIDLGQPRGHEQGGRRYGLVLSPSNSPLSVAVVVPTSTSARASIIRPELEIAGTRTRLLIDQIRTLDTSYIVGEPLDYLNPEELTEVESTLAHYLGIHSSHAPWAHGSD